MNQQPKKPADDGRDEFLNEDDSQNPKADQLGQQEDARGMQRQEQTEEVRNADRAGRPSPGTVDVERE